MMVTDDLSPSYVSANAAQIKLSPRKCPRLPNCRLSLRERTPFRRAKGDKLGHYAVLTTAHQQQLRRLSRSAIAALGLKISEQLIRLAVLRNPADDNLSGASVGELEAVRTIGFDELRLLGREMQMAREDPFARVGSGLLVLQIDVNVLDPIAADKQIAFRRVHGCRLRGRGKESSPVKYALLFYDNAFRRASFQHVVGRFNDRVVLEFEYGGLEGCHNAGNP